MNTERVWVSRFFPEGKAPLIWEGALAYFETDISSPGFITTCVVSTREVHPYRKYEEDVIDGIALYAKHPEGITEKILYLQVDLAGSIEKAGLLMEKWKVENGAEFAFSLVKASRLLGVSGYHCWDKIIKENWDGSGPLGEALTNKLFKKYVIEMLPMREARDRLRLRFGVKFEI